jgi:hypothetical protein
MTPTESIISKAFAGRAWNNGTLTLVSQSRLLQP